MLRKYKHSFISVYHAHRVDEQSDEPIYIIQTERISDELILIEYFYYDSDSTCSEIDFEPLNAPATYQDNEKQAKIDEYRAIILNDNAFNDKWSNKTLGELFQANDREFIERAKKEMKNKYIQEKIIFLDKELNGK